MFKRIGCSIACLSLFLSAGASWAQAVPPLPVYDLPFQIPDGKPSWANTGTLAGEVTVDSQFANWKIPAPIFDEQTPTQEGLCIELKHGVPNGGSVLLLPDSKDALPMDKAGQAVTVLAWVKLHALPEGQKRGFRTVVARNGAKWWRLGVDDQNRLSFQYHPTQRPDTVYERHTSEALPADQWCHVSVVLQTKAAYPNGIQVYVDGKPWALSQGIGGILVAASSEPLLVGAMNTDNSTDLDGYLDDVRLYDQALDLKQITDAVAGLSLKPLQIEDYLTPIDGSPMQTLQLQKLVDDTVARGLKVVTLPIGQFRIPGRGICLAGLYDFVLQGAGPEKTILYNDLWDGTMLLAQQCTWLTLKGFGINRITPPFVQATVTGITDKGLIEFHVHDGYPGLTPRVLAHLHGCGIFYDKTTRKLLKQGHWFDPSASNIQRIDDRRGRIMLAIDYAKVGDYVVLPTGQGDPVILNQCDSVRMEQVTIFASASLAVGVRFCTGDNYFSYAVKRGPTPPGASQSPLLSTDADGMQYFFSPGAVTFEGCDFGYMGDDGINISSPTWKVVQVVSPKTVKLACDMAPGQIKTMLAMSGSGDTMRLLRYGTFGRLGDVKLQSVTFDGTQSGKELSGIIKDHYPHMASRDEVSLVTVTLQQAPGESLQEGDLIVPMHFFPSRFVIRNSSFHDTRARGLLIMSSNGVIENNVVDHTYLAGVALGHELPNGFADGVDDVIIRNNKITNTCQDRVTSSPRSRHIAAITVGHCPMVSGKTSDIYPRAMDNHRIQIVGNTITDCNGAAMLIDGVDQGRIAGNRIERTNLLSNDMTGRQMGLAIPAAITLMNSHQVQVIDNQVQVSVKPVADLGIYPPDNSVAN